MFRGIAGNQVGGEEEGGRFGGRRPALDRVGREVAFEVDPEQSVAVAWGRLQDLERSRGLIDVGSHEHQFVGPERRGAGDRGQNEAAVERFERRFPVAAGHLCDSETPGRPVARVDVSPQSDTIRGGDGMADREVPAATLQDAAQGRLRVARSAGRLGIEKHGQAVDILVNQDVEGFLNRPGFLAQRARYREGMAAQVGQFGCAQASCLRLQEVEQCEALFPGGRRFAKFRQIVQQFVGIAAPAVPACMRQPLEDGCGPQVPFLGHEGGKVVWHRSRQIIQVWPPRQSPRPRHHAARPAIFS